MMTICTALENLLNSVRDFKAQMLEKANDERKELLDLSYRMADTHETLTSLSQVCGDAGTELMNMGVDTLAVAEVVGRTIDGEIAIPELDYEHYKGVCAECEADVDVDEDYSYNDKGELFCTCCANAFYALDEEEEDDEEEDIPMEDVPVDEEVPV